LRNDEVGHVGIHVHPGADAVARVLGDDPVPGGCRTDVRLDRGRDVTHAHLRPYEGQTGREGQPGDVAEGERFGRHVPDSHRQRRVAVEAVHDGPEVDRDEVTVGEDAFAGDAVDDLVVDRDADDSWVRGDAETDVVVEERRCGILAGEHLAGHRVEFRGRRTGHRSGRHLLERARHHQPRATHHAELVGALDLEIGGVSRHQTLMASSAAAIRSVTSSMVPLPSTSTIRPAAR